ncbi:MAG: endolytic transglycosylase MltG, partial [Bacteroidia bacterium]|nr:endolytic transglycosylase MltG [Bacteroidia bacterium]
EVDSPYNTYKYAGLPPGPICVPSKAALNAVLNPDGRDWLYFCANSDFSGTHKFASSLSEHMKNARAFQAELNRRQASR